MKISTPKKTKELLERHGFSFKKSFGQNFLIDGNVLNNIVTKSELTKKTLVLEIGPGIGALTQYIADYAMQVVAFEIDHRLEPLLEESLESYDNIDVIFEDFLKADVKEVISRYEGYDEIAVVANLPYYITTPIITKILELKLPVDRMIFMMQKEVARRLSAKTRTKDYNSLSLYIQYYCEAEIILEIPKTVFMPQPNVDSAILRLDRRREPVVSVRDEDLMFKLIRDSFTQRRKTLRNNLKKYDQEKLKHAFESLGLNLSMRAEELTLEDFSNITNLIL